MDEQGRFTDGGEGMLVGDMYGHNNNAVCWDTFSDDAAHAICRDMGWSHANSWTFTTKDSWPNYKSSVEVLCRAPYWMSCYSSVRRPNCQSFVDISCGSTDRSRGTEGMFLHIIIHAQEYQSDM